MSTPAPIDCLFVYGTLQPGDERWHHLAPYVRDAGTADSISGRLYDTGLNYPAAIMSEEGTIIGRTFPLRHDTLAECLAHLDDVEAAVEGLYARVPVTTANGRTAWAYELGAASPGPITLRTSMSLTPIPSGDWTLR